MAGHTMSCPGCAAALNVPVPVMATAVPTAPPQVASPQLNYPPPAPPQPKGTTLANISLIAGLVGLIPCLCVIPNMVAMATGTMALKFGTDLPTRARIGVLLGMVGLVITSLAWSHRGPTSPSSHRAVATTPTATTSSGGGEEECQKSLSSIFKGIKKYKRSHSGAFPPDLDALRREGLLTRPLHCPRKNPTDPGPAYAYAPPADSTSTHVMIACDSAGRHGGGRCVLYMDGSVVTLTEDQFAIQLLDPQNRTLAKSLGLPDSDSAEAPPENRH